MENGNSGSSRSIKKFACMFQGRFDVDQLHDAGAIRVLAIDQNYSGFAQSGGRGGQSDDVAKCWHLCLPWFFYKTSIFQGTRSATVSSISATADYQNIDRASSVITCTVLAFATLRTDAMARTAGIKETFCRPHNAFRNEEDYGKR